MGNADAEKNTAVGLGYPVLLTAGQVKPYTGGLAEMQMRDNAMNRQIGGTRILIRRAAAR